MTQGFLTSLGGVANGRAPDPVVPQCGACGLFKSCRSPKMPLDGEGRRRILIVGEGPGYNEDDQGRPFVGKSGKFLQGVLDEIGIDFRRDCWIYNSIICRATDKKGNNRNPTDKEIGYCRPNLIRTVKELRPEVIILLGKGAVQSYVGWVWKEHAGPMMKWAGWRIPCRKANAWVCPTWHPAYIHRELEGRDADLYRMFFRRHLENAAALEGRPWPDPPPDPARRVEVCLDPDRAAAFLRMCVEDGGPVSFDFETTTKKPGGPFSEIYTCAVCWRGKATVAYPWHGDAVAATGELLRANNPKYGWNLKFEDRWCRAAFGHPVNGWLPGGWDGMEAAHVLDNRPGITGLKFQAFARLGVGPYAAEVESYLKSDRSGGYSPNKIRQADLRKVLLYNGLDAYLEFRLAMIQREELGLGAMTAPAFVPHGGKSRTTQGSISGN